MTVLSDLDAAVISYLLGQREFQVGAVAHLLIPWFCRYEAYDGNDVLEIMMGPSVNTNITRMPYYLTYEPNPTSVKNMIHWYGMCYTLFRTYVTLLKVAGPANRKVPEV